jgi:hypothetical protein
MWYARVGNRGAGRANLCRDTGRCKLKITIVVFLEQAEYCQGMCMLKTEHCNSKYGIIHVYKAEID